MESTDVTQEKKTKVQIVDAIIFVSVLISSYFYQQSVNIKTLIDQEADFLNNTKLANTSFIIFNRNPKCASETIWALLDQLARVNHFQSNSDSKKAKKSRGNAENTYLQKGEQITYVEMFQGIDNNITTPFTYTKHINFINFEEFNQTNPIYINFVRDPVDRVVSWYYYSRQSWWQMSYDEVNQKHTLKPKNHNPGLIKMSYEECVEKKLPECVYIPGNSVHWSGMGGSHFSQVKITFKSFFIVQYPKPKLKDNFEYFMILRNQNSNLLKLMKKLKSPC